MSLSGCANQGVQVYEDPIEGTTRYFVMYLDPGAYTAVSAKEIKGTYAFDFMVVMNGDINTIAPAGTPVTFRIGNTLQTLATTADAAPVSNVNGSQVFTQWQLKTAPTREQFVALGSGAMKAIRIEIAGNTFTLEPTPAQSAQIMANMGQLAGN